MGLFFSDSKKKISKIEFQQLRSHLAGNGFTHDEINKVEGIFNSDINEQYENDMGIDEWEMKRGLDWMKNHTDEHHISEKQMDVLEKEMREFL